MSKPQAKAKIIADKLRERPYILFYLLQELRGVKIAGPWSTTGVLNTQRRRDTRGDTLALVECFYEGGPWSAVSRDETKSGFENAALAREYLDKQLKSEGYLLLETT